VPVKYQSVPLVLPLGGKYRPPGLTANLLQNKYLYQNRTINSSIMKILLFSYCNLALFLTAFFLPIGTRAQADRIAAMVNKSDCKGGLFDSDSILNITLSGDLGKLLNDRSDNSQNHPLTLLYKEEGNKQIALSVSIKTRGHFRKLKENCTYPPLLLHFSKTDTLASSVFCTNDKLKLVMPCRGDEFIIREWLVYKLYNLVTPKSFRVRLVSIVLDDIKNKKTPVAFYGILLEEETQMALRNKAISITRKLDPSQTDTVSFLTMAVFQYLVGNTDWSVQYLQNIKLLLPDSGRIPFAVPYDFDHAGIVQAPYALPADELKMASVLERRYRGYCIRDLKIFDDVFATFNDLKKDIYDLYSGCTLVDTKYQKFTKKFLDEFYSAINNTKKMQKDFGYPCNKYGTGNVVIKGLKED
jgi:hypothetical protein